VGWWSSTLPYSLWRESAARQSRKCSMSLRSRTSPNIPTQASFHSLPARRARSSPISNRAASMVFCRNKPPMSVSARLFQHLGLRSWYILDGVLRVFFFLTSHEGNLSLPVARGDHLQSTLECSLGCCSWVEVRPGTPRSPSVAADQQRQDLHDYKEGLRRLAAAKG